MINGKLQDFATGAMARGRISFGDVRRLQRDCLPQGITMREEAESLIALDAMLVRADKAWAAWLVPALADFVTAQQRADSTGADAGAGMKALFAQSRSAVALGRKVARHIRRASQPSADQSPDAQQRPRRQVRTCKAERVAARTAPVVQSKISVRPPRRAAARPERRTLCAMSLPCEIWSAGIMEKHLRFQLARPAA
jgi:hypothetical protein